MCALLREGTPKIWLSMEYIRVRLCNRGNDNPFKCCDCQDPVATCPWCPDLLKSFLCELGEIQFMCSWTISRIFNKICLCHWILMLLLSLLHLEPSPWRKASWSITGWWARAKGAVSTGGVCQSSVVSSKKWERSWATLNLPSLLAGPGKVGKNKKLQ